MNDNLEQLRKLSESLLEPEIYAQVVEELPDALIVINQRLEIVIYNKQAQYLFGYHPSEVIGHPLNMLIPESKRPLHDDHVRRWFQELRARPMGVGLSLESQRKDGTVFPVEINLAPIIAVSGIYGMAAIRQEKAHVVKP
jgi:PAS domain S-box-containing protein